MSDIRYERREIEWRDDENSLPRWTVKRWRDSKGDAGITVEVLKYADSTGAEYAEFHFDKSMYGDAYEQEARRFLEALGKACDEMCNLRPG